MVLDDPSKTPRSGGRSNPIHRSKSHAGNEMDFDMDDEEDREEDFWGKLWHSAGYRHTEQGDYVKVQGMQAHLEELPKVELPAIQGEGRGEDSDDESGIDGGAAKQNNAPDLEAMMAFAEALRVHNIEKAFEFLQVAEQNGTLTKMLRTRDKKGWSPLHWAVEYDPERLPTTHREDRHKLLKKLISFHASGDLNLRSSRGNTALVHAIWNGNLKACQMLLKRKDECDIMIGNESGWTALHWAVLGRKQADGGYTPLPEIVQLLLKKSPSLRTSARTRSGDSLLHMAAMRGFAGIAELLVKAGAPIGKQNLHGFTALHIAAMHDHEEVIRLLLENGAQLGAQDSLGKTAAHVYALSVTHRLRCGRFVAYEEADDYDRETMEVAMREWLEVRGLPASILGSMAEPEMVLRLAAPASLEQLQQPPNPLGEDAVEDLTRMLRTLELLVNGIPANARAGEVIFQPC